MLIRKEKSRKYESSQSCTAQEYDFPTKNLSFATVLVNGRYPKEKRTANTECEEIYYVISGTGTVHSEKGWYDNTRKFKRRR